MSLTATHPHFVIYDIADDLRRRELFGALSKVGYRFQQSAWCVDLVGRNGPQLLLRDFGSHLDERLDRVVVLAPCGSCLQGIIEIGEAGRFNDFGPSIVS